jgi:hypothetical protein
VELQGLAMRWWELSMEYWRAVDAGRPSGELFVRLVAEGRRTIEGLSRGGPAARVPFTKADVAGVLLEAYGRELTVHRTGSRTYRQVREHWAAADEFTPLVGPERLRHHLSGRAQFELGEGRASEALALVEQASALPGASPPGAATYEHGDLRALRAAALYQLYDAPTALDVLAPLEAELDALLPNGPVRATDAEVVNRVEAELARGGDGPAAAARLLLVSAVHHQVLDTKAGALRDTDHPEEAERAYLMLLPHYEASGIPEAGHLQLARCALDRHAPADARRRLDLVAPLFEGPRTEDRTSMRAHLRLVRGAMYCRMRAEAARMSARHEEALVWCDRAGPFLAAHPDDSVAATLHAERARALRALADPAGAAAAYHRMTAALDRVLRVPLGHRFDTLHLRFRAPLFEEALAFAEETRDARLAAVVTDLLKARAFSARLALTRSHGPAGHDAGPDPGHRSFAELTGEIAHAERHGTPGEAARLRTERAALLTRIRAADPRWHLIRDNPPFDPDVVVAHLAAYSSGAQGSPPGRCVALSLYERPDGILAVLVTPDGAVRMEQGAPTEDVRRALASYRRVTERPRPPDPAALSFWDHHGVALTDLVPGNFADEIAASGTCLLSPHGRLHNLPWTVVRHRGRHVVRGTALGVVPNLSCVPMLDHRPAGPIRAALLGVTELADGSTRFRPVARAVRILSEFLGEERLLGPPVVGRAADVAALRRLLGTDSAADGTTAVLQIATHGVRDPGTPFGSGVQMADGDVETGDVLMGRMCFEEVVLTACSTSLRSAADHGGGHGALAGAAPRTAEPLELAGDVANALVHAFHEAGAAFVLASPVPVWPRLAIHHSLQWFVHRAAGCAPLEAARRAAVALLDQDDSPEQVGNWAGITAYGAR